MQHWDDAELATAAPKADDEYLGWLRQEVQGCAAYGAHADLLDECLAVVGRWFARFGEHNKPLWARIRRGRRLASQLAELAPVLAHARETVAALTLPASDEKAVVLDLCSGFGYLSMLLSELLPPAKVGKIVLVDLQWAPHIVEPGPQHINPEHLHAEGWPIRLVSSRCDLKTSSDRRNLCRAFLSHRVPVLLVGLHLCGTLALRAVQLFNQAPCCISLGIKPCCLPVAKRAEIFNPRPSSSNPSPSPSPNSNPNQARRDLRDWRARLRRGRGVPGG